MTDYIWGKHPSVFILMLYLHILLCCANSNFFFFLKANVFCNIVKGGKTMQTRLIWSCLCEHVWAVYMWVNDIFLKMNWGLLCSVAGKDIPCPEAILSCRFGVWRHCNIMLGLSYTLDAPPVKILCYTVILRLHVWLGHLLNYLLNHLHFALQVFIVVL